MQSVLRKNLEGVVCPQCNATLQLTDALHCSSCSEIFPLIDGVIPVLVPQHKRYLAQAYKKYYDHIALQEIEIRSLNNSAAQNPSRTATLQRIAEALSENLSYYRSLLKRIEKYVDHDALLKLIAEPRAVSYFLNTDYLLRDWCGRQEGENEIDTIVQSLNQVVDAIPGNKKGSAVFLGGGTGRIAWEYKNIFAHTWCLDYSFSMACQYHDLAKHPIDFNIIRTTNARSREQMVRKVRAMRPGTAADHRIEFLVADAQHMPFANQSVDALFSVYFTDVIPLSQLLPEIKRILKPGGTFIHFGPLEYHFHALDQMLALDEVKEMFLSNDFELTHEAEVETAHLAKENSLSQKRYTNIVMSLTYNPKPTQIDLTSVLKFKGKVAYESTQVLSAVQALPEVRLKFENQNTYRSSPAFVDFLMLVDGQRSVNNLFDTFSMQYQLDDDLKLAILNMLNDLKEHFHVR